jgi:hypothetical protein
MHAAGLCKTSDEIIADSFANCVASNELQVTTIQKLNACRPLLPSTL